ncbi:MAG: hypothetical protein ACRCXB_28520 [Aeromonadaceae bacterium]
MSRVVIVLVAAAVGNHYWESYKSDKIAEELARYERIYGPSVCVVNNSLVGIECRPKTRAELQEMEDAKSLERWYDRVAEAKARAVVDGQMGEIFLDVK